MSQPPTSPSATIAEAKAAYERGEALVALQRYQALDEAGALTTPDELIGMVQAALMAADGNTSKRIAERMFAQAQSNADVDNAARAALWLLRIHMDRGEQVVAMSWMKKAERLLEHAPPCVALAELTIIRAFMAQLSGEMAQALELAKQAEELAKQLNAPTELALAINRQGRVLIRLGQLEQGQERLDEAMTLLATDTISPVMAFIIYCSTIDAYTDVADYDRASQWTDVANDWCAAGRFDGAPGVCRVHRAELLRLRGDWDTAEREAVAAREMLTRARMQFAAAEALAELGMLKLQLGDLTAAEAAFTAAHAEGLEAQPGWALLRLKSGKLDAAQTSIVRALAERAGDPLKRAKLLPAQVEIALANGNIAAAEAACEELEQIATQFKTSGLIAASQTQRGAVLLAGGQIPEAVRALRQALGAWNQINAPYESARVRSLLAEAHEREGDVEQASLERAAARRCFEVLGASLDLQPVSEGNSSPAATAAFDRTAFAATASPLSQGYLLDGKLQLLRPLGQGAMGTVFEAKNQLTGRNVAVKLVQEHLCEQPEHRDRLLQEAAACGRIQHPNVVDVYDAGMHGRSPYLVLELLNGETLGQRLKAIERFEVAPALEIIRQTLAGVQAAHEQGVIHRDLKPGNIFLVDGEPPLVKVLDFGLSKLSTDAIAKTQTGAVLGTPFYMAPEQIQSADQVDARTDVYAVAAILFELIVGEPPFIATNYASLLFKITSGPFPSARARNAAVSERLDQVLRRAGARDPAERFASADEFAAALS